MLGSGSGLGWHPLPDHPTGFHVFQASRRAAALIVVVAALTAALSACSSDPSTPSSESQSPRQSTPSTETSSKVTVAGAFGATPTVTIPDTQAPPKLTEQTLVQGKGAAVA